MNKNTPFTLFIPSKTFLLGEYFSLQTGEALIAATQPYFQCHFTESTEMKITGITPHSPAGQFIQQHKTYFDEVNIDFRDPHPQGGFGASTAQFIAAWEYVYPSLKPPASLWSTADFAILETYYPYAWNGQGFRPSGCDLMAQCHGNLCLVNTQLKTIAPFIWPWEDIGFAFLSTGYKLPTYSHLQHLQFIKTDLLKAPFYSALEALTQQDFTRFITCVQQYQKTLYQLNLVHPNTLTLLNKLHKQPHLLSVKGCGALGADVIWIIYKIKDEAAIQQDFKNTPLSWIATHKDLGFGYRTS